MMVALDGVLRHFGGLMDIGMLPSSGVMIC